MARRYSGPLLALGVAIAMLAWTWGTWPDVLVDFGGEIHVAWRLSEGDVLYRDLAYFTGPLSPYWNALVFRVFGASLRALVAANLVVLGGIACLLHGLLVRLAGALAAAAALVAFLTLFAFAQLEAIGNSNYVCPYSHETIHGALLSLAALACLARWLAAPRTRWLAAIGFLLGLVFLTKVEIFLALAAALGLGLALAWFSGRRPPARALAALAGCALAPVAIAFLLLTTALDPAQAAKGTVGAWAYVGDERITSLAFYRNVMGVDRPRQNVGKLLAACVPWLALFVPAALAALAWRRKRGDAGARGGFVPALVGALGAGGALLAVRATAASWIDAGRPLPLLAAAALAATLLAAWRARDDEARRRAILAAAFATFALAMLAKMVLHARINMYGFSLGMPATVLVVAALVGWIPGWIERRGGRAALFRGFALGALAFAALAHLAIQRGFLARKTVTVGEGADAFRADERGAFVNAALAALRPTLKPDSTLAALPEGVMINYLLRARTPARYVNYMPPELLMFGESAIVDDLRQHPPDFVALVHKPTAEYGLPWFGEDYGREVMAFVRERYASGPLIGGEPLRPGTRFGIRLLALRR